MSCREESVASSNQPFQQIVHSIPIDCVFGCHHAGERQLSTILDLSATCTRVSGAGAEPSIKGRWGRLPLSCPVLREWPLVRGGDARQQSRFDLAQVPFLVAQDAEGTFGDLAFEADQRLGCD